MPPATRSRLKPVLLPVLLVLGVQFWLVLGRGMYGNTIQWRTALLAIVITSLPPLSRQIGKAIDRLNTSGRVVHLVVAGAIWIGSCLLLYQQAVSQQRSFPPKSHDEFSYLVQMQMLSHGRLWYPMHPLGDFFDSFQIIVDPVYCSMYFPGLAMLYVPAVWLKLAPWILPLIVSGACAMVMYLLFTRLFDRTCGVISALLLLSLVEFRRLSIEVYPHLPSLLFGLMMVWAYLRWREAMTQWRWALLIGILAGWYAVTRPLDAVMYAGVVGVGMLMDVFRRTIRHPPEDNCGHPPGGLAIRIAAVHGGRYNRWRVPLAFISSLLPVILGAAPFLVLQGAFDRAVTGSILTTPFDFYADRDYPMTSFGFHPFDPTKRPVSRLPQKQVFHDASTVNVVKNHTVAGATARLLHDMAPATLRYNLPQDLLIILMPIGALALFDRRRILLFAIWPLFLGLYFFYTFFLSRYVVPIAPAVLLLVVGAIPVLHRFRAPVIAFIVAIAITSLPSINRSITDELFEPSELTEIQRKLDAIPGQAIVLFRWDPSANYQAEPVYNADVAWPDDARVIRAHDLGDRNIELYRYYASRAPDRTVYLLDRKDNSLHLLGNLRELASH